MQARYYDPVIGRFYSNDPVGFTGDVTSFNRYSYVGNNPYKYTDPDGRNRLLAIVAKAAGNSVRKTIRGTKRFLRDNGVMAPVPTGPPIHLNENDVPVSSDGEGALPKPPRGPGSVPKSERDKKRLFNSGDREAKRDEQGGKCANGCGTDIDETNSAGHHIDRHADGGKTVPENHAEVCKDCHKDLHSKD